MNKNTQSLFDKSLRREPGREICHQGRTSEAPEACFQARRGAERGGRRWQILQLGVAEGIYQTGSKVKRRNSGFTLIEIMIVLGIIGLIFSFVGVNIMDNLKESRRKGAKIQIAAFQQGLQAYYLAHNMYPHTSQDLEALVKKPTVGKVPENYSSSGYLGKKEIPKDPFGNPYRYECENYQDYTISSDGPDREQGTDDDIRSE